MIKKYYSDYVRHALRFYARNLESPIFNCIAAKKNWNACETILNEHFPRHKGMLISVYKPFDTMGDNVYETAKKYNISQENIWSMMDELERLVAQERGLI